MKYGYVLLCFLIFQCLLGQEKKTTKIFSQVKTGAEQLDEYLPLLKGKKVALIVNQTSLINQTHLVDTLMQLGVQIQKIFAPEHGFRGNASAGAAIHNSIDELTDLPIISLYGKNKKPTAEMLRNIDLLIFDIQDVGVRFYTYISTMHLAMEAAAQNNVEFLILDRPNPNGFFIDGPILDDHYKSFVGMHPIPLVHGCTVGELAQMIIGEKWMEISNACRLKIIPCKNYTHDIRYIPKVKPSPNLPNIQSIYCYPTLGLFEGTKISIGRGTNLPFQQIGYPENPIKNCQFFPKSIPGVAIRPKFENEICFGQKFVSQGDNEITGRISVGLLISYYHSFQPGNDFFLNSFDLLAGTDKLRTSIEEGASEKDIKKSWENGLQEYRKKRKKYLLYPEK